MSVAGRARGRPSNASTIENQKSEHVSTRVFKPTSRLGRTERDPARRATGKWSPPKHDATRHRPTPYMDPAIPRARAEAEASPNYPYEYYDRRVVELLSVLYSRICSYCTTTKYYITSSLFKSVRVQVQLLCTLFILIYIYMAIGNANGDAWTQPEIPRRAVPLRATKARAGHSATCSTKRRELCRADQAAS